MIIRHHRTSSSRDSQRSRQALQGCYAACAWLSGARPLPKAPLPGEGALWCLQMRQATARALRSTRG